MAKKRSSPSLSVSRFRAANGKPVGRLNIYGEIDTTAYDNSTVTPNDLLDKLDALGPIDELEVHIFSNGGDVFAGLAIYKMLKSRPEPVTAYVEGIAASIATVILCAADRVYMGDTDMLMIHDPMVNMMFSTPNARQLRETAGELERMRQPMIAAYMAKTGRSEEDILAVMDGEKGSGTWFTAEEAIDFGIADGYTPDAKQPTKAAARICPGVLAWNGHVVDLRRYPGAATYTQNIYRKQQKGVKTSMAKRKNAMFPFRKSRAELSMIEMVCPHCGADVLLNPETAEVALVSLNDAGEVEEVIESAVDARRGARGYRAELFTVTCPHCANEFVWDTDGQVDGNEGEELIETMEVGEELELEDPVARRNGFAARRPARKPVARKKPRKAWGNLFRKTRAEIAEASCPACAALVPYDTAEAEVAVDENGIEGYDLICTECGTEFLEPMADTVQEAIPMDTVAAYRKGIAAERRRMMALDDMAAASPDCEHMIRAAKRSGASVQVTSRNVFKSLSSNPAAAGRKRRTAVYRDAEGAGINGLPMPRHYSPKSSYVNGVMRKLEDR